MSDAPTPAPSEPKAPTPAPSEPQAPTISFDDFAKLDLRVAKVLEAHDHPNADRLIVLKIDLGTEQRQLVAGLRGHYEPADLVGRLIVVVKNLAPRKMRGEESQGMLLAASDDDENQVILLSPERDIAPGAAVS
ncbi:MAG: methionine--tRNA ligase subunit beta [Planctomycetota bacterium]|nr:methionine--tRNA ligase subunit beta [Planctomycetota bacterium]